jgi:biopolymer transport protein ExbD
VSRLSSAFSAACLGFALVVGFYASAEVPSAPEVYVNEDGSCTVLSQVIPCKDVGERLSAAHLPPSRKVVVNASRLATYEMVGAAMHSLQNAGYVNVGFPSQ